MIPTAILWGFVLGLWIRWWAVPLVGVAWSIVIAFIDPAAVPAAAVLGAVNALVGVVPAWGLGRVAIRR